MRTITTHSAAETEALGYSFGAFLREPALITLSGDLAAGKTVFAKGFGRGLGVKAVIKSPTYTYLCQYEGALPFYHMDAYHIDGGDSFIALGLEECLYQPGIVLLEWPSQVADILPEEQIAVTIAKDKDERTRHITFSAVGSHYKKRMEDWLAHEDTGL